MNLYIIDPLKTRITNLLLKGERDPFNAGREKYGSPIDISILKNEMSSIPKEVDFVFFDFSPYSVESISDFKVIKSTITEFPDLNIIFLSFSEEFREMFYLTTNDRTIPFMLINSNGIIKGIQNIENYPKFNEINNALKNKSIQYLRNIFSQEQLIDLLKKFPGAMETPENPVSFTTQEYKKTKYLLLANNMLATCYIKPKAFGNDFSTLLFISYEILLRFVNFFIPELFDHQSLIKTKIVVVNNTSLVFASIIQAILEIEVVMVDRLGPVPNLCVPINKIIEMLENSKVILLQEVVATGGETDRAILFLNNMLAEVKRIIIIYNLEAGIPRLSRNIETLSLCKPKGDLEYEYTSYRVPQE